MTIPEPQHFDELTPILSSEPFYKHNSYSQLWKPFWLRRSVLLTTLSCSLLLLGVTVFIHVVQYENGGLLYAADGETFSTFQTFLFRYLPTVLVALFGLVVSVIDLDVKRLHPWERLSGKPDPGSASPLLCRYDTDFVLFVLVRAFRARHWAVGTSALLLLLATIILPAVQNSMFVTDSTVVGRTVSVGRPSDIVAVDAQINTLTSQFLSSAYSIVWLGQNVPAFTTKEESFAPFSVPPAAQHSLADTITTPTTRFWTELTCWSPASIMINTTDPDIAPNRVTFDDGRGCVADDVVSFSPEDVSLYGTNFGGTYFSSLRSFNDSTDFAYMCRYVPHRSLMVWRQMSVNSPNFDVGGDATALSCEAAYFMQPVDLSVYVSNMTVESFVPKGEKDLIPDTLFNRTDFESVIVNGLPPLPDAGSTNWSTLTLDIGDAAAIQQKTRLKLLNIALPQARGSDSMVGFMVGSTQSDPASYLQADVLEEALAKAHKLLFALAMGSVWKTSDRLTQSATAESPTIVALVVPGFILATEILLACIAITTSGLLLQMRRKRLNLATNPDSLASVMVLSRPKTTQEAILHFSGAKDEDLKSAIQSYSFSLHSQSSGSSALIATTSGQLDRRLIPQEQQYETPAELSKPVISIVLLVLIATSTLLLGLKILSGERTGLPLPHMNNVWLQILLNFLPTSFATLLGAYMALLCRSYSFLKPMEDLSKGRASAKSTLLVKYTSLPPQLLFFEAYAVGHYLLACLSLMALISNVLTVTTASLFTQGQGKITSNTTVQALYQPVVMDFLNFGGGFGTSNQAETVYPTIANLSDLTELPRWTSRTLGYLPVANLTSTSVESSEVVFETDGYGVDLDCIDLTTPPNGIGASLEFGNLGMKYKLEVNYSRPDGTDANCRMSHHTEDEDGSGAINGQLSNAPSSFEISNFMEPINSSSIPDTQFCGNLTVKGWVRGWLSNDQRTNQSSFEYNATVISCQPRLKMQRSLLRVRTDGSIIGETPMSAPTYNLPPSVNFTSTLKTALFAAKDRYDEPIWHQDMIARDWSNYMYKKMLDGPSLLDSTKPLPTVELATQLVSNIFSRLFAVQLSLDNSMLLSLNVSAKSLSLWDTTGLPDSPPGPYNISAQIVSPARRIFISKPNFVISVTILVLDLLVLAALQLRISKPFLPRMPFTIASQMAFFAGSHVIDDVVAAGGDLKELDRKGYKYSYGHFIGKDGRPHLGIERAPFVFSSQTRKTGQAKMLSGETYCGCGRIKNRH